MGGKLGVKEGYGVGLWKTIRKDWSIMSSRCSFTVGNGRKVLSWKDRWCGDNLLCVLFPSLFALFVSKDVWVADVWNSFVERGSKGWNPYFSRSCNDWMVVCMESFLAPL